jgi:hypothetical protein
MQGTKQSPSDVTTAPSALDAYRLKYPDCLCGKPKLVGRGVCRECLDAIADDLDAADEQRYAGPLRAARARAIAYEQKDRS